MAGLTGFSYYKTITISKTNVSANITNGIAYVPIVNDADIGGHCLSNGYDIQFANSDNSAVLTFERLAGFAVAGGQANGDFYVLVPTVATATDTVIRCYYGNAAASDASSPENTFATANGWTGVWHMEGTPLSVKDATTNNLDVTSVTSDPASVTGLMGKGVDFDTDDNMIISAGTPTAITHPGSVEFWYKQTGTMPRYGRFLSDPAGTFYIAKIATGTTTIAWQVGDHPYNVTITSIWDGAWHHCLFTWTWRNNGTAGVLKFYHNGAQEGGDIANYSVWSAYTGQDFLFSGVDANYMCCGTLDEVRTFNAAQTAAYAKFTYYNSHDGHATGNELTWGGETALATNVSVAADLLTTAISCLATTITGTAIVAASILGLTGTPLTPTTQYGWVQTATIETVTSAVLAPTISLGWVQTATVPTGTFAVLNPSIVTNFTVTASLETTTAAVIAPVIVGGATCGASAETATFSLPPPTVTGAAAVVPTLETVTLATLAPTITGTATTTATLETTTLTIPSPTITGNSAVSATIESGTFATLAPTISGTSSTTPTIETATLAVLGPTVTGTVAVIPTIETGTLSVLAPSISGTGSVSPTLETVMNSGSPLILH